MTIMRKKHHLQQQRMRRGSLTELELSLLLYLHADFERSAEEIVKEFHRFEQELVIRAVQELSGKEFVIRTKEEGLLLRPNCWLITYAGRQALKQWLESAASLYGQPRKSVSA